MQVSDGLAGSQPRPGSGSGAVPQPGSGSGAVLGPGTSSTSGPGSGSGVGSGSGLGPSCLPGQTSRCCGDGICGPAETSSSCPADCSELSATTPTMPSGTQPGTQPIMQPPTTGAPVSPVPPSASPLERPAPTSPPVSGVSTPESSGETATCSGTDSQGRSCPRNAVNNRCPFGCVCSGCVAEAVTPTPQRPAPTSPPVSGVSTPASSGETATCSGTDSQGRSCPSNAVNNRCPLGCVCSGCVAEAGTPEALTPVPSSSSSSELAACSGTDTSGRQCPPNTNGGKCPPGCAVVSQAGSTAVMDTPAPSAGAHPGSF